MTRMMRTAAVAAVCVGLAGLSACKGAMGAPAADTTKDEAAIRQIESEWSGQMATAGTPKDMAKFLAHYASDAVMTDPVDPSMHGTAAIQAGLDKAFKDPAFSLSFAPDKVVVAKSGDVAYTTGSFKVTYTDPETKKAAAGQGVYVTVYQKGADGQWKAEADFAHGDPAPAAAPAK